MTLFVIVCLLMVTVSVLTCIFCKPVMREGDRLDMTNRSVQIHHWSKMLMIVNWILTVMFMLILFVVRDEPEVVLGVGGLVLLMLVILGLVGYCRRGDYYRVDDQGLTRLRKNEVEWSHRWDEIDRIHRRVITTGKSTWFLLDVYCKDGTVHKGLPYTLRKMIDRNKTITPQPMNKRAFFFVLGVVLLVVLVVLLMSVL